MASHKLEKIFTIHTSNKGLVSRTYKGPLQLNHKKTTQFKTGQKIWIDISQAHKKIQIQTKWDTTTHPPECLTFKMNKNTECWGYRVSGTFIHGWWE